MTPIDSDKFVDNSLEESDTESGDELPSNSRSSSAIPPIALMRAITEEKEEDEDDDNNVLQNDSDEENEMKMSSSMIERGEEGGDDIDQEKVTSIAIFKNCFMLSVNYYCILILGGQTF